MKLTPSICVVFCFALGLAVQGCAEHRQQGVATKKKTPTSSSTPDTSAQGGGANDDAYSYSQGGASPTPDPFLNPDAYGQANGTNPYGTNNPYGTGAGQYGNPINQGGGGGLDAGSIIGMFGGLLGPGGPLTNAFNGANLGNAGGAPAQAGGGSCGCG